MRPSVAPSNAKKKEVCPFAPPLPLRMTPLSLDTPAWPIGSDFECTIPTVLGRIYIYMPIRKWLSYLGLTIVAGSITLSSTFFAQTNEGRPERLIRQIDHIILASHNAEVLYRLFAENLEMPIAWRFRSYGTNCAGSAVHDHSCGTRTWLTKFW